MWAILDAANVKGDLSDRIWIPQDENLVSQPTGTSAERRSVCSIHFIIMLSGVPDPSSLMPPLNAFDSKGHRLDTRQVQATALSTAHVRLAAPAMASRMSIERYLCDPSSDEAASDAAINAAIRDHGPRGWIDSPANLYQSRATSLDVHSDGRHNLLTTGSVPETVDSSYSSTSRSRLHHPTGSNEATSSCDPRTLQVGHAEPLSTRKCATSVTVGPVELTREWVETAESSLPTYLSREKIMDGANAKEEIQKIQAKAKELEHMMQQSQAGRRMQCFNASRLTDESTHARVAANTKLAWTLGGKDMSARSIARPKMISRTTEDVPDSPSSVPKNRHTSRGMILRKRKSTGALNEGAQLPDECALSKSANTAERQQSSQSNLYCTFCQKRFHSRVEWLRHERTIHMPEELWVCCPRTGTFPQRCPFCEKVHPSPAHLADHNYLACQKKPLSERTFGRRDHFLQHISQTHRVRPEQKPARLTELEHVWRHPLPSQIGYQALHCGFCGVNFATYQERTTHVERHFEDGADMMA